MDDAVDDEHDLAYLYFDLHRGELGPLCPAVAAALLDQTAGDPDLPGPPDAPVLRHNQVPARAGAPGGQDGQLGAQVLQ